MADDPYRSLAGEARDSGAFKKTPTPFAEFVWADFFRDRIAKLLVETDFDAALKKAIALAHDPAARGLPGAI